MPFSPTNGTAVHSGAPAPSILQTPGGPVETLQFGDGPALLALHGGMGGYDQSLLLVRAALGDEPAARVIAVSRPGYLGTPLGSGATPERQADLYAGLLDRLGVSASLVIAVSAGGPSALQFALRHPTRCAGLILVSCCTGQLDVPPEVASRIPMMKLIARLPWLIGMMRWRAERNPLKAARRSIRDPALAARTLADPVAGPLLRELQSGTLRRLSERLPGTLNDIDQFSSISPISAARIEVPMLVVHGNADRVVPFAHGERVAASAPNAELVAIDGGEHVSLFTHLDPIRAKVRAFIAQVPTPNGA
jgi:pimeloyl-ACP methyl ester carboxylesterase